MSSFIVDIKKAGAQGLLKLSIIVCIICISSASVFAGPPPCPPGPDGFPCCTGDCDPSIPFDGGASLLIAAGASLVGFKAFKKKKQEAA